MDISSYIEVKKRGNEDTTEYIQINGNLEKQIIEIDPNFAELKAHVESQTAIISPRSSAPTKCGGLQFLIHCGWEFTIEEPPRTRSFPFCLVNSWETPKTVLAVMIKDHQTLKYINGFPRLYEGAYCFTTGFIPVDYESWMLKQNTTTDKSIVCFSYNPSGWCLKLPDFEQATNQEENLTCQSRCILEISKEAESRSLEVVHFHSRTVN